MASSATNKTITDLPTDIVQLIALKTESTSEYLNVALTCKQFLGILSSTREHPRRAKAIRYFSLIVTNFFGTQRWFLHGRLHREDDKPAVIYSCGTKMWYKNGQLHRGNDKPAYVESNGREMWYQHGVCHRVGNKPAKIWEDGTKEIWVNGKRTHTFK